MVKLVVLNGDMSGVEFPLTQPVTTIGRRKDNDVCLPLDPRISRRHARVVLRDGGAVLEDVGSANGTFVGQVRIHEPTVLRNGDRFRLGRTWLHVVVEEETTADSSAGMQVVLVDAEAQRATGQPAPDGAASIVFSLDAAQPQADLGTAEQLRRHLAAVYDLSDALGSILELPQLLHVALHRIMHVVPAEQGSLLLLDPATGELVPRAVRSREGRVAEGELRISRHMVSHALAQRLAILTSDATTDARFLEAESVRELSIRSAICAPMISPRGPVGVIYLDTSSGTSIFTEQDVALVAAMAAEVAIAIENARLYTDLRSAYEELKTAQEQLVRSERLRTVGILAASIAHDMANVISPLKPLIELALHGRPMDEQAKAVLQRQVDRLVAMVQRLLAFSRRGEVKLQPTNINGVVEQTLALIGTELAHRGVRVQVEQAEAPPPVAADSGQLERALLNLIINAAEAVEESELKEIAVRTKVEEDEVLVSVSDTGPGIPVEVQQRLFEPFFTTKPTGTGLGLYSCRRIVEEEHGGILEVDSRAGQGTKITIRLPAVATAGDRGTT